jgi:FkbM family methyltransferase
MGIKDVVSSSRKNITFQRHPLKFMFAVFVMKIGLSKFLKISRKYYTLHFFPTPFSRTLWIEPDYFEEQDNFFNSYVKKNDKIIDVGANIGTITLTCAIKTGKGGKVYSIEPNPITFKYLQSNIKLNNTNNVKTYNYAIGNKKGSVDFAIVHSDVCSKVIEKGFTNDLITQRNKIQVPMISIDELGLNEEEFSLLKIDVEGYEKFVILGAKNIIKKVNCIYFEVSEKNYKKYGYTPKEVFDLLIHEGFQLFIISGSKKISTINTDVTPRMTDILAIRKIDEFIQRTGFTINKL